MKPGARPWRGRASVAVAVTIFLAGGLFALLNPALRAQGQAERRRPTGAATERIADRTAILGELQDAFTAIAQRMEPSVVQIRVETVRNVQQMPDIEQFFQFPGMPGMPDQPRAQRPRLTPRTMRASGSGVVVRPDGWILTNDHVVSGASRVTVTLHDGREFTGTVRRDFRSDLALIKIAASGLKPAEFADSDRVRVGQYALAFGAPFELSDTMTSGIVSALHRQTAIGQGPDARFYPSLLQTDASINPGNSGGPLADIYGRVIGINVAINSPTGGSVGIGFAIPANTARNVMEQLITRGKVTRAYLGLVPEALTPDQRQRYGVPSGGALVTQVQEGTPAGKAGLQVEDIIVRFDGKPVADDIQLRDLISRAEPGRRVPIVVRRAGREETVNVTLEAAPDLQVAANAPAPEAPSSKLGVRVEPVTAANAQKYNLGNVTTGVVVVEVQDGSAAAEAGLQPGDVIFRVNERPVRTAADLQSALQGAKPGDTVRLVVQHDKSRALVSVQLPLAP